MHAQTGHAGVPDRTPLLLGMAALWVLPPAFFGAFFVSTGAVDESTSRFVLGGWFVCAAIISALLLRHARRPTHRMSASAFALPDSAAGPAVEGTAAVASGATGDIGTTFAVLRTEGTVLRSAVEIRWIVNSDDGSVMHIAGPTRLIGAATTAPIDQTGQHFGLPADLQVDGHLRQWTLRPGARVRVYGQHTSEADPGGAAATYRQTPTIDIVRGHPRSPVIVELL